MQKTSRNASRPLTTGLGLAALALLGLAAAPAAYAQGYTLTTLVNFDGNSGAYPNASVTLSGNTLYGTTGFGGATAGTGSGSVFSVPITGGTPTVLATFNGSNGDIPVGNLTLSGSTLYGTTRQGNGTSSDGNVFSVPITGGTPTILATFNGNNGNNPQAGVTLIGNTLYGTTRYGGANGDGNVFSVPVTGGTLTDLVNFNGNNGFNPESSLTLIGSTLYGTTSQGGTNNDGTVFSVPVTGGSPTTLASFNGNNGGISCCRLDADRQYALRNHTIGWCQQ